MARVINAWLWSSDDRAHALKETKVDSWLVTGLDC